MTTIDGRITKLEDAFGRVIPLLEAIIETQNGHTGKLDGHTRKLEAIIVTQEEHEEHTVLLNQHTALLNQHSVELGLIKGYLG